LSITAAGRWLLHSGIQEPCGGFARWYDAETKKNKPVSTEISGYGASGLIYLFKITGDQEYLDAANRAAQFLAGTWDRQARAFPFEWPSPSAESAPLAYFFDSGIIVRGLLAVWRETGDDSLIELARAASQAMVRDFRSESGDYHPILTLPEKSPLARSSKWSRGPGCYQLKSAIAWWEVAEISGDAGLRDAYLEMAEQAMSCHACFLRQANGRYDTMDRLHAYLYFLEGLTPVMDRAECRPVCAEGLASVERLLAETEQTFVRSDVLAQLLRARRLLDNDVRGDDRPRCRELQAFQDASGGFWFGRRDGRMSPQLNPVSTLFAVQALQLETENTPPCLQMLI